MKTKIEIFNEIKKVLVELFEINSNDITMEANLYEDLDLDSIDSVDLVIRLQDLTGSKIQPDEFKRVHTVEELVNSIYALLNIDI